jgi:uncharacterized protein YbbK (DUF523 family)
MRKFPRPNLVISNCLELSACGYNGQLVHDDFVKKLSQHVNYIPVCPEVAIGLGVCTHTKLGNVSEVISSGASS